MFVRIRFKASLVHREVDGIFDSGRRDCNVMVQTIPQSFCSAKIQPPLHKGAIEGRFVNRPYSDGYTRHLLNRVAIKNLRLLISAGYLFILGFSVRSIR